MFLLQRKPKFFLLLQFVCILVSITGALVYGDSGSTQSRRSSNAVKRDLERHKAMSNGVNWMNTVSTVPKKRVMAEESLPDTETTAPAGDDDNIPMDHRVPPSKSKAKGSVKVPLYSTADFGMGLYAVDMEVGNPPKTLRMIVDTGSTLTWVKCTKAYPDGGYSEGEGYVPSLSSTYKTVECATDLCQYGFQTLAGLTTCDVPTNPCLYDYTYGFDEVTRTKGEFSSEQVTLPTSTGNSVVMQNVTIGCSESFTGRANVNAADGIVGLGINLFSFSVRGVNLYGGALQLCFVDHLSHANKSSYLVFGADRDKAPAYGFMRYTSLRVNEESEFMFVDLKGISIGSKMLDIPPTVWFPENGGTALDSGSTLTYLVGPAYRKVMDELISIISKDHPKIPGHNGDGINDVEYCFNSTTHRFKEPKNFPKLQIHFADGTRFTPHVKSYIFEDAKDVQCLGFLQIVGGMNVIGNLFQENYLWQYDFDYNMLGFAPSTCE